MNNVLNVIIELCKGFVRVGRNKWLTCLRNLKKLPRITIPESWRIRRNPLGRKWGKKESKSWMHGTAWCCLENENNYVVLWESFRRLDWIMQSRIMESYVIPGKLNFLWENQKSLRGVLYKEIVYLNVDFISLWEPSTSESSQKWDFLRVTSK